MRAFLLLFPLLLSARFASAQSLQDGLHLVVGYAVSQLQLEGGRFKEENYLSLGFATAAVYHLHPFTIGVKSIAGLGAHNHTEGLILSDSNVPLRRYIQHVSISPYLGMRLDPIATLPYGLQLEAGPSSTMISLKHKDGYEESEGLVRKKSSFESKGYEVGVGFYQKPTTDSHDFTVMFQYQSLRSRRQYLVDVTEFRNAFTIAKQKSREMETTESFSLVFNFYLF